MPRKNGRGGVKGNSWCWKNDLEIGFRQVHSIGLRSIFFVYSLRANPGIFWNHTQARIHVVRIESEPIRAGFNIQEIVSTQSIGHSVLQCRSPSTPRTDIVIQINRNSTQWLIKPSDNPRNSVPTRINGIGRRGNCRCGRNPRDCGCWWNR